MPARSFGSSICALLLPNRRLDGWIHMLRVSSSLGAESVEIPLTEISDIKSVKKYLTATRTGSRPLFPFF